MVKSGKTGHTLFLQRMMEMAGNKVKIDPALLKIIQTKATKHLKKKTVEVQCPECGATISFGVKTKHCPECRAKLVGVLQLH